MESFMQTFLYFRDNYADVYIGLVRYAAPILTAFLLLRCCVPLLTFKRQPEIWAWLLLNDGTKIPITHWENVIGRSKSSDIQINVATVSRNHAVLTRYDDGSWTITDADSKSGVKVNNRKVQIRALNEGDTISIGGVEMQLVPISQRQEQKQAQLRTRAGSFGSSAFNLLLLTVLQLMTCLAFLLGADQESFLYPLQGFGGILLAQWLLLIFSILVLIVFSVLQHRDELAGLEETAIATGLGEKDLSLITEEHQGYVLKFRSLELWETLRQWFKKH